MIAPVLFGHALELNTAVVLMATFVGLKAGGLVGLLYSIPFAVVAMAILDEIQPLWAGKGKAIES